MMTDKLDNLREFEHRLDDLDGMALEDYGMVGDIIVVSRKLLVAVRWMKKMWPDTTQHWLTEHGLSDE